MPPLPVEPVPILGVAIDPVTDEDVLRLVNDRMRENEPALWIATVNVEYIMRATSDAAFSHVLARAGLRTADSWGVLWALRRKGVYLDSRVGGSDLVWHLSKQAAELGHRIFLLGGRDGVAARAAQRLASTFPGLQIAGTYAGSPDVTDESHIVDLIRRSGADILFVAFGMPQQDAWILRNLQATGVRCAMGVGGSLDYLAGTARRAPIWMQERGMEWAWRLMRQPWRWRRMLALPRYVWLIWTTE